MYVRSARAETSTHILDTAQSLVQTRGYNAFSYADVAEALGVTKASLHYHFPSKSDLGLKLIRRYDERFRGYLISIDKTANSPVEKIRRYVDAYASVLADRRMCLCGMLASESETLPEAMRSALDDFFKYHETWIEAVLEDGRREGAFKFEGSTREMAEFLVASLEGAMLLARMHSSTRRFQNAARVLLKGIGI